MNAPLSGFAFASSLREDNRQSKSALQSSMEAKPIPKGSTQSSLPLEKGSSRNLARVQRTLPPDSGLFDLVVPIHDASDIVISAANFSTLAGFVQEFKSAETVRRHGLRVRSKLLFCGPPGCGKTLCAEILAAELKLPLVVARLDAIITTYLGETASNLRKVFEDAFRVPAALFLDEFDALARARSDPSEHNEMRRVVNTLLKLIEDFSGRGVLIAATNLEQSLDEAVWRRFDEVLLFDKPKITQIRRLIRLKTRNFKLSFDPTEYASELSGFSYAAIERICLTAIKTAIINRKSTLDSKLFKLAIKDEKRRAAIRAGLSATP